MSLSGGASKSKSSSSSTQNQTQTNYLGQQGLDAINSAMGRIGGYQYEGVTPEAIDRFRNPYDQNVIDTALADINRQQQVSLAQGGDSAYNAGAFGGSRHGVADALTREAYDRNAQSTVAGLRQQGYQTALGAAQQDSQARMQYQAMIEGLLGNYTNMLAQHGSSSNMTGTGTSKGTQSGMNFGFEWSPKAFR